MDSFSVHRPRNVDWQRAAALLYGDWGTSKAYVIGAAFLAAAYASLPIILAVCALTGLVGYNYVVVCKLFPDGGGVYSAARLQSRFLAVMGSLLLVADLTVTASLSGWSAMAYFQIPMEHRAAATIGLILFVGAINYFGPKHTGSVAVWLALPTVAVVVAIILISLPHLTLAHLEPSHKSFAKNWTAFVGVILALSGVEAIANLTGVMKLDPGSTPDRPTVGRESFKPIRPVAFEVVLGTALLGWAMLSLPSVMGKTLGLTTKSAIAAALTKRHEDMLRFVAEQFGTASLGLWFGQAFGWVVGIVFLLLLLSAANTAIVAMIGLLYMTARDGEMPPHFKRLNRHGVPLYPLLIAVGLPTIVLFTATNFQGLAGLYAIGVVGAITVNLGSCTFNRTIGFTWYDRVLFGFTFTILFLVEITLAHTKPDALFFVVCVLGGGLALRAYTLKRQGITTLVVTRQVAEMVSPTLVATMRPRLEEGQRIMVAARGITPVLSYGLDEAEPRKASLYVVYVKELAVYYGAGPVQATRAKWQGDPEANAILSLMLNLGSERNVPVMPVYAVSEDPAATILDLAATIGVDYLMLGTSHRRTLTNLLRGNVVTNIAAQLPDTIRLIIYG